MVLQAFIDESYDKGGYFVLGGHVASAESWAAFTKEWDEALPNAVKGADGKYRFKMREMALPWRIGRVPQFHSIIMKYVKMSICAIIDTRDLDRVDKRIGFSEDIDVDFSDLLEPYAFTYRMLMDQFHILRLTRPDLIRIDEAVDFIFDDHSLKGPIIRGWESYLAARPEDVRSLYGAAPRFEDDTIFLPLQAADFRVWWLRKWVGEFGVEGVRNAKHPFDTGGKTIWHVILSITEDQIFKFVSTIIQDGLPPGVRVVDLGPSEPVDATPPVQKVASVVGAQISRVWRRLLGGRLP